MAEDFKRKLTRLSSVPELEGVSGRVTPEGLLQNLRAGRFNRDEITYFLDLHAKTKTTYCGKLRDESTLSQKSLGNLGESGEEWDKIHKSLLDNKLWDYINSQKGPDYQEERKKYGNKIADTIEFSFKRILNEKKIQPILEEEILDKEKAAREPSLSENEREIKERVKKERELIYTKLKDPNCAPEEYRKLRIELLYNRFPFYYSMLSPVGLTRIAKTLYGYKKTEQEEHQKRGLENKITSMIGIISLIAGLFFLSSGVSNKVLLSPGTSSEINWNLWTGIFLLIVGFGCAGFWFWRRKRKKSF